MVPVKQEKVLYLLDPIGASRRSATLRAGDAAIRALRSLLPVEQHALELPYTPEFSAEARWAGDVDWAVQPMGGRTIDGQRPGAGVAGNPGEYGAV